MSICWCSPPFIGFIPSPLPEVDEQPLANAKAAASPKQRLILLRRLCVVFITMSYFVRSGLSVPANVTFANSFLAKVIMPMRVAASRNIHPIFARSSRQRAWIETFAGNGRCKSRTSFHRGRRGERLLRPRSFHRWGLWSQISYHSLFCFFLGCGHCNLDFLVMLFPSINNGPIAGQGLW